MGRLSVLNCASCLSSVFRCCDSGVHRWKVAFFFSLLEPEHTRGELPVNEPWKPKGYFLRQCSQNMPERNHMDFVPVVILKLSELTWFWQVLQL